MLSHFPGAALAGTRYEPPFDYITDYGPRAATRCCSATSSPPRTGPGSSTPRSPSARTTSGSASSTGSRCRTRSAPTAPSTSGSPTSQGRKVKEADPEIVEALRGDGPAVAVRGLRALLPALLALRDAAALLREGELVHPHDRGPRPDAGRERADRLAPRARQARALRQVARGQRRLGALARALLGHAAADLGVRVAPTARALLRRLGRRAARARRRGPRRPAPPVHRRGRRSPARPAAARCGGSRR